MRTIVVGDIHGCYAELLQLLASFELTPDDCLISLGDIVDRGVDSVKVYDFLKNRPNTIVIMGNHERKHLRQTLSYSQEIVKLQFGDRYTEFLEWVSHRPYYHETEQANTSNLTTEFLQQTLPTPDKWLQVMTELGVNNNIIP
jgi:serine/threonine protein phosphatase 1